MKVQFVCLANSFKEGGKCVAGIVLGNQNEIEDDAEHVWVRPVPVSHHGEIPPLEVGEIEILDIVEMELTSKEHGQPHQTENYYYVPGSIKKTGRYNVNELTAFLDAEHQLIFGNRGRQY